VSTIKPYDAPPGYDWVRRMSAWKKEKGALIVDLETAWGRPARLRIESAAKDIYRWTFVPGGAALRRQPTGIIENRPAGRDAGTVKERPGGIALVGPRLSFEIHADPWFLRIVDRRGREVLGENPGDVDGLGRPFVPPLGYVRDGRRVSSVIQSFHLHPDEHLYGLGEKFTGLDKSGQRIVSWTRDALGSTSERSHKNIPFLWSTRGWGLVLDSGARITWEMGTRSCQSFTIEAEYGIFDAYLILGPEPERILSRYSALTGRAPVPPKWSFGLWLSSGGTYRTQDEIERLIDGALERGLPFDVVHIDPWWMRWRQYCDFRWNREAFPDPDGLIRKLHGLGLKLCLWEHPYISIESDLFALGKRKGYFARRPNGEAYVIDYGLSLAPRPDGSVRRAARSDSWNARVAIIDLTNPEAVAWFKDLHRPLLRQGVDVFKTDFGEDIPADAVFHDGRTGAVLHNLYPLLYNRAVSEVTREERGYGLVWSRSGTAGSQRYPVCWSGDPAADWDSLAATIRGGLSIGMSGVPFWSNDIGGYRGKPSPDLYVRWAQFGLMCSHSRMHGDGPREPWIFGDEALKIVQKYVRLRYRLFPYLYSLAHEASKTGLPILRAVPLAFPGDPCAHGLDHQFMIGPWLLAAPIFNAEGRRAIYLPAGLWFDFWTGRPIDGPRSFDIKVPLAKMPLYVRAGAIVPTMKPALRIPETKIDPLIVEVWPGDSAEFRFYEDAGKTDFRLSWDGRRAKLGWTGKRGKNDIRVRFRR
jgi:alpha-D-xyloside xylohydrolase